jgi:hypothetical protein
MTHLWDLGSDTNVAAHLGDRLMKIVGCCVGGLCACAVYVALGDHPGSAIPETGCCWKSNEEVWTLRLPSIVRRHFEGPLCERNRPIIFYGKMAALGR